ncbi:hypothetical protein ACJX0J_007622, partial [Zea mays]
GMGDVTVMKEIEEILFHSNFKNELIVKNIENFKELDQVNFKLSEALKTLWDTCFGFATRCSSRLREIFNSVGAVSEDANYSTNNIPKALEWVEKEITDFDQIWTKGG